MPASGSGHPGGTIGALVRIGPWLIAASALLVAGAFALTRRPVTAVPALVAGAVLYAGMYAQNNLPVMYASIAVGYLTWAALALWAARPRHNPTAQRTPPTPAAAPGPAAHDFHYQRLTATASILVPKANRAALDACTGVRLD